MRQTSFSFMQAYKKQFGGSLLLGKRKSARPLSTKSPIHLILKSETGRFFNPHNGSLEKLIRSQAQKFNIKIYDFAQNWSHIHMLIKLQKREDYVKFIRSLTSITAQRIRQHFCKANKVSTNVLKNSSHKLEGPHSKAEAQTTNLEKIFTLRPFTRIVSWGRDFKIALDYQKLNILESFGLIKREKKKKNHKRGGRILKTDCQR